ncbi:MAG: RNA methyltransferase [Endomicrobia bacterium]|nr:RNA methyltransferase [Endomicrobiia bacterium]
MIIESSQNQSFKNAVSLKNKKFRDESGLFLVEGQKQVLEISKEWNIKQLFVSSAYNGKLIENTDTFEVSEKIFDKLSSTPAPQGIAAVVEKKHYDTEKILKKTGLFIVLENIQDPGNVGTIIRSADAFGAKAVFVSKGSADIYSAKTIRSTMGSLFHIPVIDEADIAKTLAAMKENKISIYAASLKGKKALKNCAFSQKSAILIGNEAKGLESQTQSMADTLFKIEMPGKAESLNAAIAASIAMYEITAKTINS